MSEDKPCNIVEAYAVASKTAAKYPQKRRIYDKVADFCENDRVCRTEDTVKRNTLLFWTYDHMAGEYAESKRYEQAFVTWRKALPLVWSPEEQIRLGQKMLDAVDHSRLSIPRKAGAIAETAAYLQQAYQQIGDEENSQRMKRMVDLASDLIKIPRNQN